MDKHLETEDLTFRRLSEDPQWIRRQQLQMLYGNGPLTLGGALFCAIGLVALLWPVIAPSRLVVWLQLFAVVVLARMLLQQLFHRTDQEQDNLALWTRMFEGTVLTSGLMWGAVSIWLFPDSVVHQVYIAFVLSGICAGAVTVYAPLPSVFMLFALPALTPFIVQNVMAGTVEAKLMAAMAGLFLVLLNRVASQSGLALHSVLALQKRNAQLTRALHHQATHDSLVGLINHGEFLRRLNRLTSASARGHQDFSVVFIDLDLFKTVNDSGGHAAGDALLRAIAEILAAHTRSRDTAARVGGDEFALLLESCPGERALEIAEHLRRDIAALKFEFEGQSFPVAASIGVAYGQTGLHSSAAVLKAADAACYAAKEAGRNRVRLLPADDMFKTTGRFSLTQGQLAGA